MQSTVSFNQGFGIVGEIVFDGPVRAQPGIVKGTAANIVMGRAFTIDAADGQFQPGGTGAFGGIMISPKNQTSLGTSAGGTLAPTLVVAAGSAAQFATMGEITVNLTNAAAIGDGVYFVQATGALAAGTAGAGQTQIVNAAVKRYATGGAGLAVISLTGA